MKKLLCITLSILLTAPFSCQKKDEPVPVSETVTDFDGNTYKTVKIGDQIWMAENLRTTHTPAGVALVSFPAGNNEANVAEFGRLYNQLDAEAATPAGWHLPTRADFRKLADFLGGLVVAGAKLKDTSFSTVPPDANAGTNESGFAAKGAGYKTSTGPPEFQISAVGGFTYFWSEAGSGTNRDQAIVYGLMRDQIKLEETGFDRELLWLSVRYIKD